MGPGGVVLAVLCVHLAAAQNRYNFLSNGYGAQQHQGYQEQCGKGFRPNDIGGCIDEDECRHPIIQCGVNSDCFNTAGSFVCVCRPGYDKNEHHICVDKDECQDDYKGNTRNFCSVNENCLNEVGKYACYCKAGFVRDHEVGCRKIGSRLNKHKPIVHANPYPANPYPANPYPHKPEPKNSYPPKPEPPKNPYPPKPEPPKNPYPPKPEPPKNPYPLHREPPKNAYPSHP